MKNDRPSSAPGLAVIVPVLNEIDILPTLFEGIMTQDAEQVIIIDGGSTDGSWEWLGSHVGSRKVQLSQCAAGRARQLNFGAAMANQDMLLFLHADTQLPANAKQEILRCPAKHWGRFDVRFASPRKRMQMIAFFINLRSRISGVATGDQAMFVRRDLFESVGGFDDVVLMEDVALSKKLRRKCWPFSSYLTVCTSARRWEQGGIFKTILLMWWYRFAFFVGVSPARLKHRYRNVR